MSISEGKKIYRLFFDVQHFVLAMSYLILLETISMESSQKTTGTLKSAPIDVLTGIIKKTAKVANLVIIRNVHTN